MVGVSDLSDLSGYGYTFDDGATFPFRGKGFGISKLEAFYKRYPKHEFWLNLKDNDIRSFETLYEYLSGKKSSHIVITSSKGMEWFRNKDSSLRLASVGSVKSCGINYLLVGWAGLVPESCRNTILFIPPSMAKYFWGYPERLASRLQSYSSDVIYGLDMNRSPNPTMTLSHRVLELSLVILILFVQHKLTNASIRALASSRLLRGRFRLIGNTSDTSVHRTSKFKNRTSKCFTGRKASSIVLLYFNEPKENSYERIYITL